MESKNISIRAIGVVMILATIILNIIKNMEWTISLSMFYNGKVTIEECERYYAITNTSVFFLLNLIIVCFFVAYFALNMKKNKYVKIYKVGFYSSVVSLLIQIANIVLYEGFITKDPYAILSMKNLLLTQFILGMAYSVGYLVPLICVWKIVFDSVDKKILKVLTIAILLYGAFTLIYPFQAADYLFFFIPSSIEFALTYYFFDNVMTQLFDAMAILAGLMMLLKK